MKKIIAHSVKKVINNPIHGVKKLEFGDADLVTIRVISGLLPPHDAVTGYGNNCCYFHFRNLILS